MLVWDKSAILDSKMAHPYNSGLALKVFFLFSKMNGTNSALELY